jgi:hypothetical protein
MLVIKKSKAIYLPQTKARQDEDDSSSSYCQALRALIFPLARRILKEGSRYFDLWTFAISYEL